MFFLHIRAAAERPAGRATVYFRGPSPANHVKFATMAIQSESSTERSDASPQVQRNIPAWITAVLTAAVVGAAVWMIGSSQKPPQTMRFSSTLPAGDSFGASNGFPSLAVSPDGTNIAYVAAHNGITQLYIRQTGEWEGRPVPGSGGAHTPFFSPDGKWLGAVAGQKLLRFPIGGGAPATIARVPFQVYGVCWGGDGWIYLGSESPLGVVRVFARSGAMHGATVLDDDDGQTDHRFPEVLPGAKWMLFAVRMSGHSLDDGEIQAFSLKNGEVKTILKGGTDPHYIPNTPNGHLAFIRAGVLMVVPFDPAKLQLLGKPVPAVRNVMENPNVGAGQYAFSAAGTLVYLQGNANFGERELVSVDRNGATRVLTAGKQPYEDLALSPDGRLIATTIGGPKADIWIHNVASGAETPFTSGGEHRSPAWSADGKRILYSAYTGKEDEQWVIDWKPAEGKGEEKQLKVSETPMWPWFSSPDGHALLYQESARSGKSSSWAVPLEGKPMPVHLTPRDFDQEWVQISPDGHWIAYNSDESGRQDVYVAKFPGLDAPVKVSTEGGRHPQWSPNGKELYYLEPDTAENPRPLSQRVKLMAVPLETAPAFKAGTPHMLFQGPFLIGGHDYAVTPDGKGFIFIRESPESGPTEMKVVLNWDSELKRLKPVK
jgi:Tol biopolymer transport system component